MFLVFVLTMVLLATMICVAAYGTVVFAEMALPDVATDGAKLMDFLRTTGRYTFLTVVAMASLAIILIHSMQPVL